jgi:mRNA-degrading endonuclease toxin of MazEF toxin-antitoxin module
VTTLDRSKLGRRLGTLTDAQMAALDSALALVLRLPMPA